MRYSSVGYSWLGIAGEPKHALNDADKQRLARDCDQMEQSAQLLGTKVRRYHEVCKQYEKTIGTEKGGEDLKEMEALRREIEHLSKQISHALDTTIDLTHW